MALKNLYIANVIGSWMKAPKIWKISVLGDSEVGKTSLVNRFVYDTFKDDTESTVESKAYKRKVDGITLMVWDVSIYEEHVDKILRGSKAILVVGDITRKNTLNTMHEIARFLDGYNGIMIFIGNKSDLKYQAEFWKDELKKLADEYSSPFYFTSAKTGENVENVFREITGGS